MQRTSNSTGTCGPCCRFIAALLLAVLLANRAAADILDEWSYDRLFKAADLVVVAKLTGEEKTKERFRPTDRRMTFGRVISRLSVQYTLKGKCKEEIKIYHFELVSIDDEFVENVPRHVRFRNKAIIDKKTFVPPPEYLLFLKKRKDGDYEFVTGDWHSDQSVREVLSAIRLPIEPVPICPPEKKATSKEK